MRGALLLTLVLLGNASAAEGESSGARASEVIDKTLNRVSRDFRQELKETAVQQIDLLEQTLELSAEQRAAIEEPLPGWINRTLREWKKRLRPELEQAVAEEDESEAGLEMLSQLEFEQLRDEFGPLASELPWNRKAWLERLKEVVPADRFDPWLAERERLRALRRKESERMADEELSRNGVAEYMHRHLLQSLHEAGNMAAATEQEREALEAPVDDLLADELARIRESAIEQYDALEGAQRKRAIAGVERFYMTGWSTDDLEEHVQRLLEEILPAEKLARLERVRKQNEARTIDLMQRARVVALDAAVRLSEAQRAEVWELSKGLPKESDRSREFGERSRVEAWKGWSEESEKALMKILDDVQQRLWAQSAKVFSGTRLVDSEQDEEWPPRHPDAGPAEEEEREQWVTEYLVFQERELELKIGLRLEREAEEAIRLLALTEPEAERIRLAKAGTAAQLARAQISGREGYTRRQLEDVDMDAVPARIQRMKRSSYSMQRMERTLLSKVLDEMLDESQRAVIAKEVESRLSFRRAWLAEAILGCAGSGIGLSGKQWKVMRAELLTVLEDYGPDLEYYFGTRSGPPWYFSTYYLVTPGGGLPEDWLEEHLSPAQLSVWSEKILSRAGHYWTRIEEAHEDRLEREKEETES